MKVELIESASTEIAEYSLIEAGLAELKRKYGNIVVNVSTPKELEDAKRVRAEIREPRYETEKIRKALKAPALAHAKLIDTEAARITAELLAIETPWDEAIKAEEARKEAEKASREAAEKARIIAINKRISDIREFVAIADGCRTAARVDDLLTKLSQISLDDFAEFSGEAVATHTEAMQRVQEILVEKRQIEQEQERIKAEQAAAAAKLAAERAEFEAAKVAAKAEADRIAAEHAAQVAAYKAKADAELAAQRAAFAAFKAEQDAEAKKLADERAAFEKQVAQAKRVEDLSAITHTAIDKARQAQSMPVELLGQLSDTTTFIAAPEQAPAITERAQEDIETEAQVWEPSDADCMLEAIKAVSSAFNMTTEKAAARLAAVKWTL
jgi:hypothetical protein